MQRNSLNASWEDLRAFLLCTRHQSFRNAAEVLGLTGTTLMRKIDRLEEELGVQLLLRDRRSVKLTDAGKVFLAEARATLLRARQAADRAQKAARGLARFHL